MSEHEVVRIHHAGVVGPVLEREIVPAFSAAAGFGVERTAGHSVTLARRLRKGESQADVYISADAEVNAQLFARGDTAAWFLTFAGVAMTLIYSPNSRFRAELDAAATGQARWYELVQQPGFALRRNSAADDPGGYRAVLVVRLAERHYGKAGLADHILGGDDNAAQLMTGGIAGLESGADDAAFIYATLAQERRLPQIVLPDAINLGNPAYTAAYAHASYTAPDGFVFRGTPARLSVTIPRNAHNQRGAEEFVRLLLSATAQDALARYGFLPAPLLVGGDAAAVPAALQPFVQGSYGG